MGADKIRCEVRAFDDELDERETLIECNKQREKTRVQRANETDKLRKIKAERARRKQLDTLRNNAKFGVLGGRGNTSEEKPFVQDSEQRVSGNDKPVSTFHHSEPSPTTAKYIVVSNK